MRILPFLPVPLVMAVLGALRPAILTAGFESVRAFAAMAAVGVAGVLVLAVGWRRWRWGSVWVADAVVLVLILAIVWPAFRVRTLEEDFPPLAAADSVVPVVSANPSAGPSASVRPAPTATRPASGPTSAPPSSPSGQVAVRVASGELEGIDHHATGTVAVYRVGDRLTLRFEGIDVEGTPTPTVHVVQRGEREPDDGRRLGGLKAERGSFSYAVPAGVDAGDVATVLIWCDRFDVPIAAADLRPA